MYTIDELRKDLERYNKEYMRSCEELESSAWADDDGERAMQTKQKWLVEQLLIVLPKLEVAERELVEMNEKIERALEETEKANRDYRAMYAEHEGVFVDGYSGIAQILRGASQ